MDWRMRDLIDEGNASVLDEFEAHSLFDDPTDVDLGDDLEDEEWREVGESPRPHRGKGRRPPRS